MTDKPDELKQLAVQHDMADHTTIRAFERVGDALRAISDEQKMDRGLGLGSCDFWIKIAGREWFIEMRPSNNQLAIDGGENDR